eukprot:7303274-Prymnesium_polylepis.1
MPCAADMRDVPLFAPRFTGGTLAGGRSAVTERQPEVFTLNPKRVVRADTACVAHPTYVGGGTKALMAQLQPFVDALRDAGHDACDGF